MFMFVPGLVGKLVKSRTAPRGGVARFYHKRIKSARMPGSIHSQRAVARVSKLLFLESCSGVDGGIEAVERALRRPANAPVGEEAKEGVVVRPCEVAGDADEDAPAAALDGPYLGLRRAVGVHRRYGGSACAFAEEVPIRLLGANVGFGETLGDFMRAVFQIYVAAQPFVAGPCTTDAVGE